MGGAIECDLRYVKNGGHVGGPTIDACDGTYSTEQRRPVAGRKVGSNDAIGFLASGIARPTYLHEFEPFRFHDLSKMR
ncbi:hypothetical protein D3C71_1919400 [compost metagenome]